MTGEPTNLQLHAYVISLANAQSRRRACKEKFENGLPYTIIDAVDGRAFSAEALSALTSGMRTHRLSRPLTPGEVGCALSHQKALQHFIATGDDWALILEDDFAWLPFSLKRLRQLLDLVRNRADVDLVKLGGMGPVTTRARLSSRATDFDLVATTSFGLCTHAYLISRPAACKLSGAIIPVRDPYDHFLGHSFRHKCRVFETSPWLIGLDEVLAAAGSLQSERAPAMSQAQSLSQRLLSRWTRWHYALRNGVWNARRFGWRAVFAKSSFRRFPSGET